MKVRCASAKKGHVRNREFVECVARDELRSHESIFRNCDNRNCVFLPRERFPKQMSPLNSFHYYKLWKYDLQLNKAGLEDSSDTCQKLTDLLITRSLPTELMFNSNYYFPLKVFVIHFILHRNRRLIPTSLEILIHIEIAKFKNSKFT